jgi:hypothetical protein
VCQRYDEDHAAFSKAFKPLSEWLANATKNQLYEEPAQQDAAEAFASTFPKLRLDIHCIYIFAKITFINYAALLFEMAGEESYDWKQINSFRKRIARTTSPDLLQDFARRFGHHIN